MRTWLTLGTAILMAGGLMEAGCASSGGGQGSPSGCPDGGNCPASGGAAGSAGAPANDVCGRSCAKAVNAGCPNGNEASCTTKCEQGRQDSVPCSAQFDRFLECLATNGTPGCNVNGEPTLIESGHCAADWEAYQRCQQGTGGAAGGGAGGASGSSGFGGSGFGGIGGSSGGTGTGGTSCESSLVGLLSCADFDLSDPCDECMNTNCCTVYEACWSSQDCSGLFECIWDNGCDQGTQDEQSNCVLEKCSQCIAGLTLAGAMAKCTTDKCGSACQ
jgi:hypothetical protein